VNTVKKMEERLQALSPENIEILDESGKHLGHAGAKGGGGHYDLCIVSPRFTGCSTLARHRLVYEALGDLMHQDIHALAIRALAPNEI
jgi:BolA protein